MIRVTEISSRATRPLFLRLHSERDRYIPKLDNLQRTYLKKLIAIDLVRSFRLWVASELICFVRISITSFNGDF